MQEKIEELQTLIEDLRKREPREKAINFAKGAHGKQRRKYTGVPYWNHCLNVAMLVGDVIADEEVLQAAILHDTLEDTNVSHEDLVEEFGERVANLVLEVSDVSRPEDGNRAKRKELDRAHYAKSSPEGATIKIADLIDNTRTIATYDKDFARIYLPEKERCLEILKHGDPTLWLIAFRQLQDAKKEIGL